MKLRLASENIYKVTIGPLALNSSHVRAIEIRIFKSLTQMDITGMLLSL